MTPTLKSILHEAATSLLESRDRVEARDVVLKARMLHADVFEREQERLLMEAAGRIRHRPSGRALAGAEVTLVARTISGCSVFGCCPARSSTPGACPSTGNHPLYPPVPARLTDRDEPDGSSDPNELAVADSVLSGGRHYLAQLRVRRVSVALQHQGVGRLGCLGIAQHAERRTLVDQRPRGQRAQLGFRCLSAELDYPVKVLNGCRRLSPLEHQCIPQLK
jgi:hypothetical protein